MSYSGRFTPKNLAKYLGDARNITYRSLWERKFMKYCDETPGILRWSSEEVIIRYTSPVDGQVHRYFPDFRIDVRTTTGTKTMIVEIKPKKQQSPPKQPKRRTRKFLSEAATFAVNQAKWKAAEKYCAERHWQFLVLNETHLNINGGS